MTNEEKEIVKSLENHEGRIRNVEGRLNTIEIIQSEIKQLTISVHDMSNSIKAMLESQAKMDKRLDDIESEPGTNWKNLKSIVLSVIITAIIAFILSYVGLK